jgi:hypothetical protein
MPERDHGNRGAGRTDVRLAIPTAPLGSDRPLVAAVPALARGLLAGTPSSPTARSPSPPQVVCVDEFQDTDPLQVELVHLIAGHGHGS